MQHTLHRLKIRGFKSAQSLYRFKIKAFKARQSLHRPIKKGFKASQSLHRFEKKNFQVTQTLRCFKKMSFKVYITQPLHRFKKIVTEQKITKQIFYSDKIASSVLFLEYPTQCRCRSNRFFFLIAPTNAFLEPIQVYSYANLKTMFCFLVTKKS